MSGPIRSPRPHPRTRTSRTRTLRVLTTLLCVLLALLAVLAVGPGSAPAQAHVDLEGSRPANGSALAEMPRFAALTFGRPVTMREVTVTQGGEVVPQRIKPGDPTTVQLDLRQIDPTRLDPAGEVSLMWMLIDGEDGHETTGTVTFGVGPAAVAALDDERDAAAAAVSDAGADLAALDRWTRVSRVAGYLATAGFLGGLAFVALLWPAGAQERRMRLLLGATVVVGVLAALGSVAVDLARAPDSQSTAQVLLSDYARVSTTLVLLWALALVVLVGVLRDGATAVRSTAWRVGALVVAVGMIRVTGMRAHAPQTEIGWLGSTADFLHVAGISVWLGGLLAMAIALLPRRDLPVLAAVVPRYSQLAMVSVLAIVASGLIMLYQIALPIPGFWGTDYARTLLLKLVAFGAVIAAAMASKRWVDRRLDEAVTLGRAGAVRSFSVSVYAEAALAVAVLAAASTLVTSSPGL
ncbi:copper resistance CopC/CopD family protein [Nocardioides sp.]|uniref:copper resistance CopC/CopD family protein n=1 Tax=Nocardioides sp. TaxID=35761 RepID=UPI003517C5D1